MNEVACFFYVLTVTRLYIGVHESCRIYWLDSTNHWIEILEIRFNIIYFICMPPLVHTQYILFFLQILHKILFRTRAERTNWYSKPITVGLRRYFS
jgi:hypothetical protein